MNSIPQLTAEQKNFLLSKSPFVLPDNPSDKHFSPAQIKRKMYEGLVVLYDYINQLIGLLNANITLSNADVASINSDLGTLSSYFSQGIANRATADKNGNDIVDTYETQADYASKRATDQADYTAKYNENKGEINKIKDGTTIVEKAENDEEGNRIMATYGVTMNAGVEALNNKVKITLQLVNKLGNAIYNGSVFIETANTELAGILLPGDKIKINNIASDIATALTQAEAYADALVARANLVNILGNASTGLEGLMSASDKSHLDTLYALLGDTEDSDTVIDTIKEVLAIFEQYPEGADLVAWLGEKINYDDIVDNLTTQNALRPLSAKQGYVLKGLIDTETATRASEDTKFLDGTYTVKKAERDAQGNKIDETYFNHEEGFAVGLVSVDDYNENTGEITIRYNSEAITDVSYNSDTGEVTFTY